MGTYDNAYDDYQVAKGESRRAFTYLTLGGARFLYATGARLAAMKFVSSISASADVLALAAMEVDVTKINPGSTITVKWRENPFSYGTGQRKKSQRLRGVILANFVM